MQERWAESVPCRDGVGRDKHVTIRVTREGDVAFIAPPGDAAVWQPSELNALVEVIRAAQLEAMQQRGAW